MRLSARLIFFLVIGISLVTFLSARYEVEREKRHLRSDLEKRAQVLAESLQEIAGPALERGNPDQLRRVVERLGDRTQLTGVVAYDQRGTILAASSNLEKRFDLSLIDATQALSHDRGFGEFVTLSGTPLYVYFLPLHRGPAADGVLAIFQDASYIEAGPARIWRVTLLHVTAQVLLIVLITFLIIRWTIAGPIAKTVQWLKDLRAGTLPPRPRLPDENFLKPLSQELTNLAKSLAQARASAKEEAKLREAGESLWTAERLHVSMQNKLLGRPLFVISNREPYEHVRKGDAIEVVVPASGLVTALEPILRACNGTWIAHGSGDADPEAVDQRNHLRAPPDQPQYTLRRVWLTREEHQGYYFGFSNEGLWPLCHIAHTRPKFRAADWEHYRRVNEKFCRAVLEEVGEAERPVILIQDYHFALLPELIKERRPEARVAIFWHIPWPNPEAFGICPWQRELLDGLLGADLIGFQIQSHCNNFLETVDATLESRIEWEHFGVNRLDHFTIVRPYPISVAFPERARELPGESSPDHRGAALLQKIGVQSAFLGVGVDRVDYTKGIVERFRGIERFFEKNPAYREQFTFVQIGAPSRTAIERYQDLLVEVEAEAERVNARFQTKRWKPILFLKKHHSHQEIEPLYKMARLCLVTSLHDGMNLVAKEFVASRDDDDGVLILSRFTGASRELRDALVVNPYDTEQLAEAIRRALEMSPEERKARMQRLRRTVKEHNVYRWAANLMSELAEIRLDKPETLVSRGAAT